MSESANPIESTPADSAPALPGSRFPARYGSASLPLLGSDVLTRCGHRLYLDTAYHALVRGTGEPVGVTLRRDAARSHRAAVRDWLAERHPGMVVIDPAAPRFEQVARTIEACSQEAPLIWGARFPDDEGSGRRWRAEAVLADPAGGYLPLLVVNHKVIDPGAGALLTDPGVFAPRTSDSWKIRPQLRDQLALVQARLVLDHHGWAGRSGVGAVIGQDGRHLLVHRAADTLSEYHRRFDERMAIATGATITAAKRVSECRRCLWWQECEQVLGERRDISLIAPGSRGDALRSVGIDTIDTMAGWTGRTPEGWSAADFADLGVIARAWLHHVPLVRRKSRISVTRADVEIDVDMECYQEFGAYLWGALDCSDGAGRYHAFVTWDPLPTVDEARSFAEFWRWLMRRRHEAHAAGRTFAAYCYSRWAEDKWLLASADRFAGYPGVPSTEEIRSFIDSPEWVDMFEAVGANFIAPGGRGLKKLAPIAGFTWRDDEAGGEASMAWYRRAVGYDAPPDLDQRDRLLEYNEDDVRATRALREWMSTRAADEVPLATAGRRPA